VFTSPSERSPSAIALRISPAVLPIAPLSVIASASCTESGERRYCFYLRVQRVSSLKAKRVGRCGEFRRPRRPAWQREAQQRCFLFRRAQCEKQADCRRQPKMMIAQNNLSP